MIGVNPPGHFLWDPKATDAQIRRYSRAVRRRTRLQQAHRRSRGAMQTAATNMPDRFWGLPFDRNAARIAIVLRADGVDARTRTPLSGADDARTAGSRPRRATPAALWFLSLMARMAFPEAVHLGRARRDRAAPTPSPRSATSRKGPHRSDSILGNPGTRVPLRGRRPDRRLAGAAGRERVHDASATRTSPTLLVGGTLDFATPPVRTRPSELLPHLPNGHQVVLPGSGTPTSFWSVRSRRRARGC